MLARRYRGGDGQSVSLWSGPSSSFDSSAQYRSRLCLSLLCPL
jgi:hypothetical protein